MPKQATVKDVMEALSKFPEDTPVFGSPSLYDGRVSPVRAEDIDDFVMKSYIAEGYENEFFGFEEKPEGESRDGVCVG